MKEKVARPDVLAYEQGRQDKFAAIQEQQVVLEKKLNDVELAIQQARTEAREEVAREIIGELESCGLYYDGFEISFTSVGWQAFKDKYLKEKK